MAHVVLQFFFTSLLVSVTLPSPSDSQLLPLERMEKAYILFNLWKQWYENEPWDNSKQVTEDNIDKSCDLEVKDTLRVMYFIRFQLFIDKEVAKAKSDSKNDERAVDTRRRELEYSVIQDIAKYSSFYEENLGSPPLRDSNLFGRVTGQGMNNTKEQGDLLFWPPDPYPIVCDKDSSKYVNCTDTAIKSNQELTKACNLEIPPKETFDGPSPGQLYLIELKKKLEGYPIGRPFRGKNVTQYEGGNCSAPPWKSIGYIALNTVLKVRSPENVKTYDQYERAIEGIRILDSDFADWKNTLDNITLIDIDNLEYCKYETMGDKSQDYYGYDSNSSPLTGGLICGGTSCKLCKDYPREDDILQRWNYETGPLHKACTLATKLTTNKEDRPPSPPKKEPCETYNDNCGSRSEDPCKEYTTPLPPVYVEYKTNADRWRKFANTGTKTRGINCMVISSCLVWGFHYWNLV